MVLHLVIHLSKILLENFCILGKHVVNVLVLKLQKTREHCYWFSGQMKIIIFAIVFDWHMKISPMAELNQHT